MSEMVEQVAKAVWPHTVRHPITGWENFETGHSRDKKQALAIARAAIEAMLTPTEAMVAQTCVWTADPTEEQAKIGHAAVVSMQETDVRAFIAANEVVRDWQTMITAALA